jgi:hypothetical protein
MAGRGQTLMVSALSMVSATCTAGS